MKRIILGVVLASVSMAVFARGGGGGGHSHSGSHSSSPGTGANMSSSHVSGYTRQNGTHVNSHERSSPDGKFNNNWTTKGNTNPYTHQEGTRTHPSGTSH
ncbi:hypothetical protein PIN31009_01228 [Pandoraea iniqua]|nr:hypothetical protein PIN31009_01228 [Pandoraea iniqua]